jgi:hypothetical protein
MTIKIVEFYKDYFIKNSLVNFIKSKNIEYDIFWFFKKRSAIMFPKKCVIVMHELLALSKLMFYIGAFRNKRVIAFGGHYSLLLITKLFGRTLGKDYHLYLRNFYLHSLGNRKVVKLIIHFLLSTKYTTLIVQSPQELSYFSPFSKNSPHFLPYCEDPEFGLDYSEVPEGDYLFTGGYSNRDYGLILECARNNPQIKFVLVVSRLHKAFLKYRIPSNAIILKEVNALKFNGLMYRSSGVIIPLKENVGSSGQMLCLGALKMSKAVIYCDITSINYYFENAPFGIPYKMGDIGSLNKAVRILKNFTMEKRNVKILDILYNNSVIR